MPKQSICRLCLLLHSCQFLVCIEGTLTSSTNGSHPQPPVVPTPATTTVASSAHTTEREETTVEEGGVAADNVLEPSFRYISGICVDDRNRLCITEEDTARLYFYSVGGWYISLGPKLIHKMLEGKK